MSLSIANESIPVINVPIYVIGPAILTQELTSIGINQSLIKPITINQLAGLPNGSVAVIDWPLVRPSIVVSDPGGKVEVNLTSPVIRELINATARGGDVIGIYANASDEDVVEFILAYSWARAVNNELVLVGADFREEVPDYLTAYPIIPVSGKEPVIFVVRWVKPRGLIIGPIYANQLTQLIVNIMRPTISLNAVNASSIPWIHATRSISNITAPQTHHQAFTQQTQAHSYGQHPCGLVHRIVVYKPIAMTMDHSTGTHASTLAIRSMRNS